MWARGFGLQANIEYRWVDILLAYWLSCIIAMLNHKMVTFCNISSEIDNISAMRSGRITLLFGACDRFTGQCMTDGQLYLERVCDSHGNFHLT